MPVVCLFVIQLAACACHAASAPVDEESLVLYTAYIAELYAELILLLADGGTDLVAETEYNKRRTRIFVCKGLQSSRTCSTSLWPARSVGRQRRTCFMWFTVLSYVPIRC